MGVASAGKRGGRRSSIRDAAAHLGRISRTVQTGAFINIMWGEAGTALGAVQMLLVRLFMIWPLKAVAPAAYAYWAWQIVGWIKGRKPAAAPRPHGLLPWVRSAMTSGLRELMRFWLSLEAVFFLFYLFKHGQLTRRLTNMPVLPPGKPQEAIRRALDSVKMIQAGGKIAEPGLTLVRSLPMLAMSRGHSPPVTPIPSAQDLQQLLRPQVGESGIEQLLRDWHDARTAVNNATLVPLAVTDADRAAMAQLLDDAELLAMKQAEVSGWFLRRPGLSERWPISRLNELRQGNITEWVAWAFLNCSLDDVPSARRPEVEELSHEIIKWMEVGLEPGYNPEAAAMRLTMDPIPSAHRPLIYYAVTQTIVSQVLNVYLRRQRFSQHRSGTLIYWHRPGGVGAAGSGSASTDNGTNHSSVPIVFCHGIGVNLLPYRPFLNQMLKGCPGRSFFLISLPHISMRIKEEVPSSSEMVACLSDMLASWGFASAHFVGHSFGTLSLACMAKKAPQLVSMMTFVDPVCFLLVKPDVCYNFMYRTPADPTQLLISYFLAKELYIAHCLSRNFFWHQHQIWPEELPGPTLVVLSGRDSIIPTHSVRRFLTSYKHRCNLSSLRVLWFPDLGHGEINFGPIGEAACVRIVSEMLLLETEQPEDHFRECEWP